MEIIKNENLGCELQVIRSDSEIWFKGKSVCDVLGYTNSKKAILDHIREKHKKSLSGIRGNESLPPIKGDPQTIFISEPGLYSLIMKSKMPHAE